MIDQARTLVEKQVRRVQRRLFAQVIVESLVVSCALALLLSMFWFLLRPFAFVNSGETVRWSVPGVLLGVGMLAGLFLAWLRQPSRVVSSLALDEKFGLKERVTTLLTLSPDQLNSAAGQALLLDVTEHLRSLEVSSRFPLRISLHQFLLPTGALALALLAAILDPMLSDLKFGSQIQAEQPRPVIDAKEVQQQMDALKQKLSQRTQEPGTKSEDLKELEKEFEKLINQPFDQNEEKIRERVSAMHDLKEKMKERLDGLKDQHEKDQQLKNFLEKLGLDKDGKLKDGPAKDFEDALVKGEFSKAKEILDKLAKDLKNDKMSKEKQKELAEQFKQVQDKLKRMLDKDDFRKQIQEAAKEGKITKEQLERELEKFKDLEEFSDLLGECRECLDKLGSKKAGEKLEKLMERFKTAELTEEEIRELLRDQEELDEAARILLAAMAREQGEGEGDGQAGGNPGGRRRANPDDPNSKILDQRQKAHVDKKGAQRVTGYAKGGTFSKIPRDIGGRRLERAEQDAAEALSLQRVPQDAAPSVRAYFEKLRGQK